MLSEIETIYNKQKSNRSHTPLLLSLSKPGVETMGTRALVAGLLDAWSENWFRFLD